MITAPSPIATIAPGLPGKGASPGGGEAFALSMLSVGTGVAADAPAASTIASRQAIAVPGMVLPTTDTAVAPDPAQGWLPSVTIAVPAPIDVPPALASAAPMVAVGRPVAPALRGSTSIGALAVTLPSAVVTGGSSSTVRADSRGDPKVATIDIAEDGAGPLGPVGGLVRSAPFAEVEDSTGETTAPAVKSKISATAKRDHKLDTIAAAPERVAAAVGPTLETDTGGETRKAEPMPVAQPEMTGTAPPVVAIPLSPTPLPDVDAPPVEAPRGKQRVAIEGSAPLSSPSTAAPLAPQASQPRVSATGERPVAGRVDPSTLQPSTAPAPVAVGAETNTLTPAPPAAAPHAAPQRATDRAAPSVPYAEAITGQPAVGPAPSPIPAAPGAISTPFADPTTRDARVANPPPAQRGAIRRQAAAPAGTADPAVASMPSVSTPATVPLRSEPQSSDATVLAQRPASPSFRNTRTSDVRATAPSDDARVATAAPFVPESPVPAAPALTVAVPTRHAAMAPSASPTVADDQVLAPSADPQRTTTAPSNAAGPDVADPSALAPRAAEPTLREARPVAPDAQPVRSSDGQATAAVELQRPSSGRVDAAAPVAVDLSFGNAGPIVIDAPASRVGKAAPDRVEPATPDAATAIATPIERLRPNAFTAAMAEPLATPVQGQQPVTVRADAVVSQALSPVVTDSSRAVATPFGERSYRGSATPRVPTPAVNADLTAVAAPPAPNVAVVDGPVVASPVQPFETASAPALPADRQTQPAEPARVAARGVTEPAIARGDAASPVIAASAPVAVAGAPVVPAPAVPTPAVPTPAATPVVPRQSFVREVSGSTRQNVALAPQAATPPQPAAGVTAPAAHVFGAAIHAASGNDERPRIEQGETGLTAIVPMAPIAAGAPMAPIAAGAPVADAGQPPLDMRQNDWPAVMIDRIEVLRDAANANDTRIRLVPDALGAITVAVKTVGDAIHVRFAAEDTATRALIEEAQPKLVAIAEERGLKIGQTLVEVTAAAQQNAAQQNAGQQNNGQQNSGQQQAQGQAGQSPASSNANANGQQNAAQSQAQSQAQAQTGQQPRQQHTPSARQPASPARASSNDTDAAGNGRIA